MNEIKKSFLHKRKLHKLIKILRGKLLSLRCTEVGYLLQADGDHIISKSRESKIFIGNKVRLFKGVSFYLDSPSAKISIGHNTYINRRTELMCKDRISIGNNCAISWDVTICDTDYHSVVQDQRTKNNIAPITIKDNVWIGNKVIILKGVIINEGSIIAAGSVVTRDVPPNSLVAGNPAKVIKKSVSWK